MRKIPFLILSIAFALLCGACTEVSFPTHQPRGINILTEIPQELHGKFILSDADSIDRLDTLIIEAKGYHFTNSSQHADNSWLDTGLLSDSLVLKKYKSFYFFNFKEKDQWLLRVLKLETGGHLSFRMFAIDGTGKDKLLWELEKELPVQTILIDSDEKYYRIDPSPKQLLQLIKKKKYWEESKLKRVK
jgi:hypothetical protein